MIGTYDPWLVLLSIAVAVMASYVALDLASRVFASAGRTANYWLSGGAVSMGIGIWSMHFIGMLAFRLPVPMSYHASTTLLSLLIAIVVSGFAIFTVSRAKLGLRRLAGGGVLMGMGIAAMHYTGMAAMRMSPAIRYDPMLFALSIAIAIVASWAALWIAFRWRGETLLPGVWRKVVSAKVMGASICGMHYTGMAATIFSPHSMPSSSVAGPDSGWMAVTIGSFAVMLLATTMLVSLAGARRARELDEHQRDAERMLQAQDEMEAMVLERTAELGESERRFGQIAGAIREVFWMSTPHNDRHFYVGPAYETVWGRSLESLRLNPKSFIDAIHPEDRAAATEAFAGCAERAFELTYRVVRPDGSIRLIRDRGFPVRDEAGEVYRIAGIAEDISESNANLEALRQSQFDLAEAQHVARLGNWSFDITTEEWRCSDEIYRIFEFGQGELGGRYKRFIARVCLADRARVIQASADARQSGHGFELDCRIDLPQGRHKHIRAAGYARRHTDGTVSCLFGTAQDITDYTRTVIALGETSARLRALSRRLVDVQEAERAELARELHDRVGQNLTALNINLSILSASLSDQTSSGVRARLADSETLVEATAAAIRNVLTELRPPMLDDQGLLVALDWQAREVSKRSGLQVIVDGPDAAERFPPRVEIAFFRIVQEAVNNVVKHAAARQVTISLDRTPEEYVLAVLDDGVGIDLSDEQHIRSGLGIATMRERSQSVGGAFQLRRLPGRGTLLTVRVPK